VEGKSNAAARSLPKKGKLKRSEKSGSPGTEESEDILEEEKRPDRE